MLLGREGMAKGWEKATPPPTLAPTLPLTLADSHKILLIMTHGVGTLNCDHSISTFCGGL